ncbi:MBL fold metallo-hydrolase [Brevibacillus sp. B_LB10_24]|uniref:MBL fold metallo-hydrolase n=1 Tax=Brevibacillus sp. B_LB10_24 TaxID=3380645 RepID=UPI0038BA82B8
MEKDQVIVKVIGTAQDAGIPHIHCRCEHCRRAWEQPQLRRYPAALAVIVPGNQTWHLIDATPDIASQMEVVRSAFPALGLMNSVVLTHAHLGHYTGLMYLGREAMATKGVPVYAGSKMADTLRTNVPWKQLVDLENISITTIFAGQTFELDTDLLVTPLEVPHRNEYSETFGFIFSGRNKRLLYIPDIDRWELWDQDLRELVASVDYCLLDATFYSEAELAARGRDYREIPHPCLTATMELLQDTVKAAGTKVYFTHFNHTNPVVDPEHQVRDAIKENGFFIAEEGMEFFL